MPLQTPILAFGSYRPDVVDYEGINSQLITNVVRRGDGYGPFPDLQIFTANLPGPCRGGFTAQAPNGQVITFAATANKLYKLDNATFTWVDVSRGGGTYATVPAFAQWQFVQFNSLVLATQENDVLQVFNLASSTAFSNNPGSPPQAASIAVVGQFVVLLGLLNLPFRMQWSGLGDTTNWTAGLNSSDFQDFTDGGITMAAAGGEYGVIFQARVIRQMTYAPGSSYIFQITRICEDQGLLMPYALARAESQIFFLSSQGWQQLSPGALPVPIGKEKIDRSFIADWDNSQQQLLIGTNDPNSTRVLFAYKSVNGLSGLMDTILVYDYVLQDWTPIHGVNNGAGIEYLFTAAKSGITLETLDAIYPALASVTGAVAGTGNLSLQSNAFSNVAWTNVGTVGLASGSILSPDGTVDGWAFVRSTTAVSDLQQSASKAASQINYMFSVFVKPPLGMVAGTPIYATIYVDDGAGVNRAQATINLQSEGVTNVEVAGNFGNAIPGTLAGVQRIPQGGGWLRVWIAVLSNTATTLRWAFSCNSNNSLLTGTDSVSNSAVFVYGAQIEQMGVGQNAPSIYLSTTAAAVSMVKLTLSTETFPPLVAPTDTAPSPTVLTHGQIIDVSGVGGTTEANGEGIPIVVYDSTHIGLQGIPFVHAYTSGGTVAGTVDAASNQQPLDDFSFAGIPALAAFNSANGLGFFNGQNLAAALESSEHSAAGMRLGTQGFRPITDAATALGTMSARESLQGTRTYGQLQKLTSQGIIPVRRSGRYMRARLLIPAGTSWTYATGVEPIMYQDGER